VKERWKPIPKYPGYEVSDCGRVRSYRKKGPKPGRDLKTIPRIMKQERSVTPSGGVYRRIGLNRHGKQRRFLVHRLVLLIFRGKAGKHTRHLNNKSEDNNLTNLRAGCAKSNAEDRRRHGTLQCGEKHYRTRLTNAIAVKIVRAFARGISRADLRKKFKIPESTLSHMLKGRSWSWVVNRRKNR
jgi:hypothetical protein